MFKKGNNIFSLLVIILSIFMTSFTNIVNADATSGKDWGNQLITKVQLQDANGTPQDSFGLEDTIQAYWEFTTPSGGVNDGDTMTVTVPKQLTITGDITTPQPVTETAGGKEVGTATLNKATRQVTITFNSYAAEKSKNTPVTGSFFVRTSWDKTQVTTGDKVPLDWNVTGAAETNTDSTTNSEVSTGSVPDPNETLYKYGSYMGSGDEIQWTVRVNYKGEEIKDAVYKDTIGENQTLLNDADHPISINSATADHTTGKITNDTTNKFADTKADTSDSGFTINLGDINQPVIIVYYTKITNLDNKSSSYSNTGDLLSNKDELQNITINQPNTTFGSDAHTGDEKTSIMGHKLWSVPSETVLPDSVKIDLLQNGTKYGDSQTITKDSNWSYVFNNLPKYDDNGTEYKYTVQEEPIAGFTATYDSTNYDITNIITPDKTQFKVTKIWHDGKNQDDHDPIEVGIFDGESKRPDGYPKNIELSKENGWSYTFTNLDSNTTWYVSEENIPSGYISADSYNNGNTYDKTVTNTLATSLKVTKAWDDNDSASRPKSIQVQLYTNDDNQGEKALGDPVTLNSDNSWSYTFGKNDSTNTTDPTNQLPKYDSSNKEITYTAKEVATPKGYTATNTYNTDHTEETITNKADSSTSPSDNKRSFTVNKIWSDNNDESSRPNSITVQLTANGTNQGDPITLKPDTDGNWTYTWNDLDKTDSDGKTINYSVTEEKVSGYDSNVDVTDAGATITNTKTATTPTDDKTDFKVTKSWNDNNSSKRPSSIQVQLLANGKNSGDSVTLDKSNNWTYDWKQLDKKANNKDINYTVSEITVPNGYSSSTTYNDDKTAATITNTLNSNPTPSDNKTHLTVSKKWSDNDNQDGLRPESVKIQLLVNGKTGQTVELNAKNNWQYDFANLDTDNTYSIKEISVPCYTSNIDTLDSTHVQIINTHTPNTNIHTNKSQLSIKKVWDDNNNQDNIRPANVTVHLLKNGLITGDPIILNADNNWSYIWKNLSEDDQYTIQEDSISGYVSSQVKSGNQVTITNTHTPTTTSTDENTNPLIPETPSTPDNSESFTPQNPMVPNVPYTHSSNNNGSLLPQTGSKESNIIYSISGLLILLILVLTFKKKRI